MPEENLSAMRAEVLSSDSWWTLGAARISLDQPLSATPGTTPPSSRACHAPPCSPHAPSSQAERPPRPPSTACTSRRLEGAPSARLTPHANPQPEPGARRRAVDRARPLARCPPPHARSLATCTRTSPDSPLSRAGRAACRTCTPTAAASGPTSATRTSSSRAHRPRLPRLPFASPAQCTSAEGYDRSPRCQRRSDLGCAAPTVRRIECPCTSGSGAVARFLRSEGITAAEADAWSSARRSCKPLF